MQKNKKLIAIILFAAALIGIVLGIVGFTGQKSITPTEARHGVVFILTSFRDEEGNGYTATGTGWAVGRPGKDVEYIVTNGHVVQNAYLTGGTIDVYFSMAENDYVSPQVVYYSAPEEKDIAILKLPSPTDKRMALSLRASDTVDSGETAYALGYPATSYSRQDYLSFDEGDITMTKGIVSKRTKPQGVGYDAFQMDTYISGGNSGGPLVDEKGSVIGINTLGAVDPNTGTELGMNYAIVIDELTRVLDSEGVEYTMAGSGGLRWMSIVFLPIAALLIGGGVVMLTLSPDKKKAAAGTAAVQKAAGENGAAASGRAAIKGVTGKYAGQSFGLLNGRLVIGRDPALCNIIYEKDTPGISGHHCEVAYDAAADCFTLTDMGSTYGTFLGSGKRLAPQAPVRLYPGDTFYLCDAGNKFSVTKE